MIPRRRPYTFPDELEEIARQSKCYKKDPLIVEEWERQIATYVGTAYAASVSSGRRGMRLIFKHLNLREGDQVIAPAYTLKDLIPLIADLGAKVIPADIDPETFNISPESVVRRLGPRTRALLVLHAFGSPCDMERLSEIASKHGIPIVEDCAHSLGATHKGVQTGILGEAGFYSFESTKPINTFGGGMVVSSHVDLIDFIKKETALDSDDLSAFLGKVKALRTERFLFGTGLAWPFLFLLATPAFKSLVARLYRLIQHAPPSNVSYSSIQAHLGLKKFETLDERVKQRNQTAKIFTSLLAPEIHPQRVLPGCVSTWYFYVVLLPCKAAPVRRRLLFQGVDAAVEDEIADDCASLLGYDSCPNTRIVYERALALPFYDGISEEHVREIAAKLKRAVVS